MNKLIYCLFFIASHIIYAYGNDSIFHKVTERLHTFQYNAPREKIYVHQDRTQYIAGETIWFKVYQTSLSEYPVESRVVYVDLIDGMNRAVAKTKWKLENGTAIGQIVLPDSLTSGLYQFRAYTQWMQNFGTDSYFTRELRIASRFTDTWGIETDFSVSGKILTAALRFIDRPEGVLRYKLRLNGEVSPSYPLRLDEDGEAHLDIELPDGMDYEGMHFFIVETSDGDREFPLSLSFPVQLTFFPEGGNLVAGLPSKIAFKVTNREGHGLDASGVIVDNEGKVVRHFSTHHLGHGYFYFEPEYGKQYTARLNNLPVSKALPDIYTEGMVMDVRRSDDRMRIALKHNFNTSQLLHPFYLTIHQEGFSWFNAFVQLNESMTILDIPKEKLPEGIFTITIYDDKLHAYCERLAFINYPEQLNIIPEMHQTGYRKRQEVIVRLDVKDNYGAIERGDFSVAVVKAGLDEISTRNNFYSDYFLQSELQGKIEAPASYFIRRDTVELNNLDLLLLTQGWRRYNWDCMVSGNIPDLYYSLEKDLTFSGLVQLRNRDKNLEDISVNALFQRDSIEEVKSVHPDSQGAFRFEGYCFYDTMEVVLSVVDKKNRTLHLSVIEQEGLPYNYYTYGEGLSQNEKDSLIILMSGSIPRSPTESMDKATFQLPEVSVTAKAKVRDHRRLHNETFNIGTYEVVKHRSYGGKWGALGILFYTPHVIAVDQGNEELSLRVFGADKKQKPLLVLDGSLSNQMILQSLPPTFIERVEVLNPTTAMVYGKSGGGAILFFTRSWKDMVDKIPSKTVIYKFSGYNRPKEFYSPDYATSLPDHWVPDHRNTLYWAPNVGINEDGKLEFSFFTSDDQGELLIHCEGRSEDGVIGVSQLKIDIQ